jgi:hypothetical protein
VAKSRKKSHRDKVSGWVEAADFYDKLSEMLDSLPPLQSKSVKMHYGLQGSEPHPVEGIVLERGISEDEVASLTRQAITNMRTNDVLLSYSDLDYWTKDWVCHPQYSSQAKSDEVGKIESSLVLAGQIRWA